MHACTNMTPPVQSFLNLFRLRRLQCFEKSNPFVKALETLEIAAAASSTITAVGLSVEKREFQGSKTPPPTDRFIHNTSIIVNRVTKQIRAILYAAVVAMCLVCLNTPPHSVQKVLLIVDQRLGLQMSSASWTLLGQSDGITKPTFEESEKWRLNLFLLLGFRRKLNKLWKVKVYWLIDTSNNMERLFFAFILLSSSSLISKTIALIRLISCVTTSDSPANFQRHLGSLRQNAGFYCSLAGILQQHGLQLNVLAGVG